MRAYISEQTYTDSDLATHDADDLKVGNSSNPVDVADTIGCLATPAVFPAVCLGKIGAQVADGEEDVTLETKTSTGKHSIVPVPA